MEKIRLTNSYDEEYVSRGDAAPDSIRSLEIEALVDTGATMLMLPADVVAALGLREVARRKVRYANGDIAEVSVVAGVKLTILGRDMVANALVERAGTTALIGQIPLEELDLLVDPKSRKLHVNPASPEVPLLDALSAA